MHTYLLSLAAVAALTLGSVAHAGQRTVTIIGSGQNKIENRQVGAFDAINVGGSLTAMITVAADQPQSVQIRGDDNLVPLVRATVSGTALTLDVPPNTRFVKKLPLVVTVSAQALHALRADASSSVVASAVSGGDVTVESRNSAQLSVTTVTAASTLTVTSDGSATLTATTITAGGAVSLAAQQSSSLTVTGINATGTVTLVADSSSTVQLGGAAPMFAAQVANSSTLQAQNLSAVSATISASNSSSAELCATTSLNATLTNNSFVGYHCNPSSVVQNVDQSSTLTME
jgi:hypothetical protein